MMNFFQTADHRILQLEEEIEDLIGNRDQMNPEIYDIEYRLLSEDLVYARRHGSFIKNKSLIKE